MKLIPDILFEDKPNTSTAVTSLKQWHIEIKRLYSASRVGNSLVTQDPHGGRRLLLKNGFKGSILLLGEQMPTQQLDKGSLIQCIYIDALAPPYLCWAVSTPLEDMKELFRKPTLPQLLDTLYYAP